MEVKGRWSPSVSEEMMIMSHLKDLKDDLHSDAVLSILNEQRIQGILCDVTIIVEDTKFKAHSNILAASSLYFKNMFWSHTICLSGHVLELDGFKAEVFTEILNFIYSSTITIKKQETVVELAAAGKKLGISFLEDLTEKSISGSPCQYSFCNTEENVKEEKRQEDSAITNGPRITNAYSIFETENSHNLFSPLDLRASFKKLPETNKASFSDLDRTDTCKDVERVSTLAEHSYAVTTRCDAFQQNSFYHENSSLCKTGEDCSETAHSVPLSKSVIESYNAPKAILNSQVTDTLAVKISAHKGTSSEDNHIIMNDHSSSFEKSQTNINSIITSKEAENKSDHLSGPIVTDIPYIYNCNYCTKSFSDEIQFTTHLLLHSQTQEMFVCRYCTKQFENTTGLETHEQACGDVNNVCIQDEKEQTSLDHFARSNGKTGTSPVNSDPSMTENEISHYPVTNSVRPETDHFVKVVDGQVLYTCNVCKRTYVTLSSLRRHSNVHSWRRTYPCHYCNKVFALAEYRTRHEIWHTGERRYQCIFCLETFMTYYILKNHQKSFHTIDHQLGVNRKTANGSLKQNVYPYKLYRLLPMKCKRGPYKSYRNSSYESVQVNEVPSSACIIQSAVTSEESPLNFPNNMLPSTMVSLVSSSCGDATATLQNPPDISSWETAASGIELKNDIYTTRSSLSSAEDSVLQEHDSSLPTISNISSRENSTSVINYNNPASSVIVPSGRVSSVIMHSNAVNTVGRDNVGAAAVSASQVASSDLIHESDNGNTRTRSNKEKKKALPYDREETSKEAKYLGNTGMTSNTPTDNFETSSKIETYIAKPALPGTSADSNVAPLCQITVKIGNEAIVKRHILGSKLFCKKGRRSKYESKEGEAVQGAERERRERSSLSRVCRSDYIESEMGEDVSDQDSSDKPWRPYYNYKPKKKAKQLKKIRKARWREKYRSRKSCEDNGKTCVATYALRNIPEEKVHRQEDKETISDLYCELCERENTSTEAFHWQTINFEPYTCDLCQKHFENPCTLRTHRQSHTGEKPYLCKSCGRGFSVSSNLQKYEQNHSGVKDFICQHCNKEFTLNETLKIHERIHSGKKRYN